LANVCGGDKIPLAGVIFENLRQDLWWKFVDGNIRVPDRPSRLQNLREIPLDAKYLQIMSQSATRPEVVSRSPGVRPSAVLTQENFWTANWVRAVTRCRGCVYLLDGEFGSKT